MKCPFCSDNESKVVDKRENESEDLTRRRRECLKCEKRFTTYERIETDLMVVKKDGRREQFKREKLKNGMLKACEKRPVDSEKVDEMVNRIEALLRDKDSSEVQSKVVGELVMKELKKADKVAYIRFASVYRDFADANDFEKELMIIKGSK